MMLFLGGVWKILEHWARNTVKYYRQCLMGRSSRTSEYSSAESYVDCGGPAEEVSDGDNVCN